MLNSLVYNKLLFLEIHGLSNSYGLPNLTIGGQYPPCYC